MKFIKKNSVVVTSLQKNSDHLILFESFESIDSNLSQLTQNLSQKKRRDPGRVESYVRLDLELQLKEMTNMRRMNMQSSHMGFQKFRKHYNVR